jgi:hypothetical protein
MFTHFCSAYMMLIIIKNKIILLKIFYIFRTKVNEGMVNFEVIKNYLKENLILEKHISFKNLTLKKYNTIVDVQ